MKKHIANLITLTSMCIATLSIIQSCNFKFEISAYLIFICFFLDGIDGMVARNLKISNEFGKQLDSFCDMIAFGLAPSILMYNFFIYEFHSTSFAYVSLLIPICSALRLANYNIETNQVSVFSGLTTPASAILFGALPLINIYEKKSIITEFLIQPLSIVIIIIIISILLISPLQTFNMRIDVIKNDKRKMLFLFLSIMILFIFNFAAIPIIILIYIILSMLKFIN